MAANAHPASANGGHGITFCATSNTNLTSRQFFGEDIDSAKAMLHTTNTYEKFFQAPPGSRHSIPNDKLPKALVIHGTHGMYSVRDGLVGTVLRAYNGHNDLQLRPDDIWITIQTQFAAYVNGRAEKLRHKFVSHEGQKELEVKGLGDIYSADFALLTHLMLEEIGKNIKDESLKDWILPGFSTTTRMDEVCAAATTMCAFQKYFSYKMTLCCGIPRVTLLGEVDDWKKLRSKVDRLLEFEDDESPVLAAWVSMLRTICDNFVESSERGSENNLHFWDTICSRHGGGSGPKYLSGWITAFSFFNEEGNPVREGAPAYWGESPNKKAKTGSWLMIDTNDITANVVSCPVKIDDNGKAYKARLFVGQMTHDAVPATEPLPECIQNGPENRLVLIQPRNDWALAVAEPMQEAP